MKMLSDTQYLNNLPNANIIKRIKGLASSWLDLQTNATSENLNELCRYEKKFNSLADSIFLLCEGLEKEASSKNDLNFIKDKFFSEFNILRQGKLNRWAFDKPYGYAGDFYLLDRIYQNNTDSEGLGWLLDNYFLMSHAAKATRNRKDDFKTFLKQIVETYKGIELNMMDLASGPCRDLKELLCELDFKGPFYINIDCIDHDLHAIEYGKEVLKECPQNGLININFIQKNAYRMALSHNIESYIKRKYDLIFSTGLFDYLDDHTATRLIMNLKKILRENGLLIVSNYRDSRSNPSRIFMDWVLDWNLIYRSDDNFLCLFKKAGFKDPQLSLKYESQQIMQYCFAKNT